MHMADALLSPAVGMTMNAVSAAALGYSASKIKKDELSEKKLPIMSVAGAFVFAAQMINFTIPATGSSGHLGGGILLAALLGGFPACLTLSAVLIIQCLFFADGGLLALGCNVFNIAVIPCLVAYPLIFKPLTRKGFTSKTIGVATVLSVMVGLQLGAFGVVVETVLSGVTMLPFDKFGLLMLLIHLAIGAVEGVVTAAILVFVYKMRPEIMESTRERAGIASAVSMKKVVAILSVVTLLAAGALSLFASGNPDGLEWSIEKVAGATDSGASSCYTAVAGIVGSAITFALAGSVGFCIRILKKKKRAGEAA